MHSTHILIIVFSVLVCVSASLKWEKETFEINKVTLDQMKHASDECLLSEEGKQKLNERYKCKLETTTKNCLPRCTLTPVESDSSKLQDVKCKRIHEVKPTGRGHFTKSGQTLLDEGRFRTKPGDDSQCEFLPTDSLLYPNHSSFPICNKGNTNIFDANNHEDVVSIHDDVNEGRCRIEFLEPRDPIKILKYANYLEEKARSLDSERIQRELALNAKWK